jgi:hypothetical protein
LTDKLYSANINHNGELIEREWEILEELKQGYTARNEELGKHYIDKSRMKANFRPVRRTRKAALETLLLQMDARVKRAKEVLNRDHAGRILVVKALAEMSGEAYDEHET